MWRRGAALLRPAGFDELGLRRALVGWMLPFLVAAMTVLAALAIGGVMGAAALARHWQIGPAAVLTVQVPRPDQPAEGAGAGQPQNRLDRVVALLRETPGIALARPLPNQELLDLLRPWLGNDTALDSARVALPLPGVVEVRLTDGAALPAELGQRLAATAPGTLLEGHGPWLRRLSTLARSLQACALAALALVAGIAVVVVGVATRSGLAARREAIEIVHGLGATDAFIARRFAARITWMTATGGLAGTVLALPMLAGLAWLALPFISTTGMAASQNGLLAAMPRVLWTLLPGLPLLAGAIGWTTAQVPVRRWLRQLP